MANSEGPEVIKFEQGWAFIQKCITKVTNQLEGVSREGLSPEDHLKLYNLVYKMSTQEIPDNFSEQIYEKFKVFLQEYLTSRVLPAVREKCGELMLKELMKRWGDHKALLRRFRSSFAYLDRYHVPRTTHFPDERRTVAETGVKIFRDFVYAEVKVDVKDALIAMINRERAGEHVDRVLLSNIIMGFFVEIGFGEMESYETDFESFMLQDTGAFYRRTASSWIREISCPDYMTRAEECLKQEKERVRHYLHASTEPKLLETVQEELLSHYQLQLLEKEDSGCRVLLRDGKVDDLSRMYGLFFPISKGLEPIAAIFRQHVTDEGTALVKQATDNAASNKKVEKKEIVGVKKRGVVQKVMGLHDKYLGYVAQCVGDNLVFHEALEEAFEVLWNKGMAGSTSAEVLASFCDSLLK